jgi:amino acid adenylation domain-containing protein
VTVHETVVDLLRARASGQGGYTFLLDGQSGEEALSFAQLDEKARAIGAELASRGAAGERVLLLYPPGLEYVAGFFGCLYAGAVAVPVYPPRPDRPLGRFLSILSDAQPRFALATSPIRQLGELLLGPHAALEWLATDQTPLSRAHDWRPPELSSSSLAFLQYTSGSTADPKGVRVTHRNLLHNEEQIRERFGTDEHSVIVGWLPLYHDMGLIGNVLHPLYVGSRCVLMSPLEFLRDPLRWLEAVSTWNATVSGGPNFAFDLCVRKADPRRLAGLDLSCWRVAFNGAEPVRPDTLRRFAQTFAPCGFDPDAFLPCYGLAEGTLLVSAGRATAGGWFSASALEQHHVQPATAGEGARELSPSGSFRTGSVEIVHPQSRAPVSPGEIGEIWVRSESVADGYWQRPELSEATFRAATSEGQGPFLRTGDLGFVQDGRLFVTGRLKDLLVLRGRNHYPQDLERTAELAHPALRPGCSAAFATERDGEERAVVVAEVVVAEVGEGTHALDAVVEAVRAAVAREHEVQLDTVVLIAPRTLPKTSSGKVQRRACRQALLAGELAVVHQGFREPEVELPLDPLLSEIARLSPGPVSQSAPLALDSLQRVELAQALFVRLGVQVPSELIFGANTVSELAAALQSLPPAPAEPVSSSARLSVGQRALWFLSRLEPESAEWNVANALSIRGPLDPQALARAFGQLMLRHPLLCSTFPAVDGEPVRQPGPAPELVCEPLAGDTLRARLDAEARRPFQLEREPAVRAWLFLGGEEPVLMVVAHHLVTDLQSQGLLLEELEELYRAARDGRPADLPAVLDHGAFVAWQEQHLAGPEGELLLGRWLQALRGAPPALELPTRPRPRVRSREGAEVPFVIEPELSAELLQLARHRQVTPFVLLLAAFQALLMRYTGQPDLVVGTVAAGRTRPSHARMQGYFVNPLVLRARAAPFGTLLLETRAAVQRALADQELPFARLVERLRPDRDPARSPVFQALFVLQQGELAAFAVPGAQARHAWADLELSPVPLDRRIAQFDLGLTMALVEGRLHGAFDYPVDLFDPSFVSAMAEHFYTLLRGIVASPDSELADLPLLSPEEQAQQLVDTERPVDERPIHVRITEVALTQPAALAVICGSARRTYGELHALSERWARGLRERGVGPEDIVALCLERSVDLPAAILAVLKAGAAWLPLDPSYPEERRAQMIADARASLVVQRLPMAEGAGELPAVHPEQIAAVIYTSGSTGEPKGVLLTHRALGNLVDSFVECYRPGSEDRILPATSIASASFVGELLPLLCSGGAVVIPTREELLDEALLTQRIVGSQVTVLSTVPSRLVGLGAGSSSLRWVLSGGEALTSGQIETLGAELVNGYGLTETTACSTWHPLGPDDRGGPAPLGRPLRNTRVYVLDTSLRLVPPGVEGELFVGGLGLARGYHGRGDLTAERFLPDPFGPAGSRMFRTGDRARRRPDGVLLFAGRADHQVKVRGHRIELEEIEAHLQQHPEVADAVVTVRGEGPDLRLCGYLVPRHPGQLRLAEVLELLRARLPEHQIPELTLLDALPLSPGGKVDRAALPEPARVRPELAAFEAPRSTIEQDIARLWAEVLGLDRVGLHDNFFDLGGHSLLLSKLHARLQAELHSPLSLLDLFRYPTVAAQAERIGGGESAVVHVTRAVPQREPLAIIAMAGRFPGARDPDQLWRNLAQGLESITFFTDEELRAAHVPEALLQDPSYVRARGAVGEVEQFDAAFFGYSPREAELIDPQQRLFLECAWEAMERAGYDPGRYGGRVGVFGGVSMNTYLLLNLAPHLELVASLDTLAASLGNDKDTLTSRVSYKLGLTGPSITIQSASSTSLVAVHVACEALLGGTCDMALAGGASLHFPEASGYRYQQGGTTSIDGHCRAYDADATGFVSGNGAGIVLLKRLSDAIRDGDHIHAVIRGTACNNDGTHKVNWTAPSVDGQVDVYRQALASAGVAPDEVGYIEGHGTGTHLGDPIELLALNQVFAGSGDCALGSLKTNVGHLDTAAGICGLIKAAMCVERAEIAPSLHFRAPNPRASFGPFTVPTTLRPWTKSPRIAGVTSLGMGGTNAHVVLGEAPPRAPSGPARAVQLLALSARTPTALDALAAQLAHQLEQEPALPLADVAFTLAQGRKALEHRRVIVASDLREAVAALRSGEGERGQADGSARSLAFLFPGQGSQFAGMGRELYASEFVYREAVDEAAELLVPLLGLDLRERLHGGDEAALAETALTQPALFVVERALALWLRAHGLVPQAMAGHSLGEYVAAHLAGVFTLPDALGLVAARGRLMQAMPPGSMLAVALPAEQLQLPPELTVAAVNHPDSCVISGPTPAIRALQAQLVGVTARELRTSHAFHSPMLEPAAAAFLDEVRAVRLSAPRSPFLSNVTGTWITPEQATSPEYWAQQMRAPVRFAQAVEELLRDPGRICVEVGPGHALSGYVRTHPARQPAQAAVTTMRHPRETGDDRVFLLRGLGRCWASGAPLATLHQGEQRRRVVLPTYPFERKRHWVDPHPRAPTAARTGRTAPPDWTWAPVWREVPAPVGGRAPRTWLLSDGSPLAAQLERELGPSQEPPERVVWVHTRAGTLEEELERGLFAPLALVRSLVSRHPGAPLELCVVSTGVYDVTGAEALVPARAAALGAVRVLPLEVAGLEARLVDVDRASAAEVAAEIHAGTEPEVALRGRRRWIRAYAQAPAEEHAPALRPWGTWVLTGGLGGLGLQMARWLAESVRARLVLVSRGEPTAAQREQVRELEARGAEVELVAADVSAPGEAQRVVQRAVSRFGAVHGLIHAAGVPGGRLALIEDRAGAERVLAPKVRGILALEEALRGQRLEHVILCSSMTSVVAMPGQVDYVAANAVLDALATARAREGLPWVSIGWDAWREVGMAARAGVAGEEGRLAELRAEMMRDGLTNSEGLGVLAKALQGRWPHLVISTHPLDSRLAGPRSLGQPEVRQGRRAVGEGVEEQIASLWREMLGVDEVGLHDNFFDLGGSSLIGIRLVGRIRAELGVEVSEVDLLQSPTVAALARRVRGADTQGAPEGIERGQRRRERRMAGRERGDR